MPKWRDSLLRWLTDLQEAYEGKHRWSDYWFKGNTLSYTDSLWKFFPCYPGQLGSVAGRYLELSIECWRRWFASRLLGPGWEGTYFDWAQVFWGETNPFDPDNPDPWLRYDRVLLMLWTWFVPPHLRSQRVFLANNDPGPVEGTWGTDAGRLEYLRMLVDTLTIGPLEPFEEPWTWAMWWWPITAATFYQKDGDDETMPNLSDYLATASVVTDPIKENEQPTLMLPLIWTPSTDTQTDYTKASIDKPNCYISVPRLLFGRDTKDTFGNKPPGIWTIGAKDNEAPVYIPVPGFHKDTHINGAEAHLGELQGQPISTKLLNQIATLADIERYTRVSTNAYGGWTLTVASHKSDVNDCCVRPFWDEAMEEITLDYEATTCYSACSENEYGYSSGSGPWWSYSLYWGTPVELGSSSVSANAGQGYNSGCKLWGDEFCVTTGDGTTCWPDYLSDNGDSAAINLYNTINIGGIRISFLPYNDPSILLPDGGFYVGWNYNVKWYLNVHINITRSATRNIVWMASGSPTEEMDIAGNIDDMSSPIAYEVYARVNPPKSPSDWHYNYSPAGSPKYSLCNYTEPGGIAWSTAPLPLGVKIGEAGMVWNWNDSGLGSVYRHMPIPIDLSGFQTELEEGVRVDITVVQSSADALRKLLPDPPEATFYFNAFTGTGTGTGLGSSFDSNVRATIISNKLFGVPKGTYGLGGIPDPDDN